MTIRKILRATSVSATILASMTGCSGEGPEETKSQATSSMTTGSDSSELFFADKMKVNSNQNPNQKSNQNSNANSSTGIGSQIGGLPSATGPGTTSNRILEMREEVDAKINAAGTQSQITYEVVTRSNFKTYEPILVEIYRESANNAHPANFAPGDTTDVDFSDYGATLNDGSLRYRTYVAKDSQGNPQGFISIDRLNNKSPRIDLLIVRPDARNKGIGTALVEEVLRTKAADQKLFVAFATQPEKGRNPLNKIHFWSSFGTFSKARLEPGYFANGEDAYIMDYESTGRKTTKPSTSADQALTREDLYRKEIRDPSQNVVEPAPVADSKTAQQDVDPEIAKGVQAKIDDLTRQDLEIKEGVLLGQINRLMDFLKTSSLNDKARNLGIEVDPSLGSTELDKTLKDKYAELIETRRQLMELGGTSRLTPIPMTQTTSLWPAKKSGDRIAVPLFSVKQWGANQYFFKEHWSNRDNPIHRDVTSELEAFLRSLYPMDSNGLGANINRELTGANTPLTNKFKNFTINIPAASLADSNAVVRFGADYQANETMSRLLLTYMNIKGFGDMRNNANSGEVTMNGQTYVISATRTETGEKDAYGSKMYNITLEIRKK